MPTRRDVIPKEFFRHIDETDYDLALVTGDLVREESMRTAMPPLPPCHFVVGNMDYGSRYNFHEEVQIEELGFLLLHGTQLRPRGNIEQIWQMATRMNLDVGVHGHTHKAEIKLHQGRLFLNPGTISGATGGWGGKDDATFIELEVTGTTLKVHLFHTDWSVVKKSKICFRKEDAIMVPHRD